MIYSSCDIECDRPKLVIMCHSYPFTSPLPKNPKNHNFEKTKKIAGDIIFFTSVPKTTVIWGMVPEKKSETDKILCHFGPFFALLPSYQPWKSKFWKNEKKHLRISLFYTSIPKIKNEIFFLTNLTAALPVEREYRKVYKQLQERLLRQIHIYKWICRRKSSLHKIYHSK